MSDLRSRIVDALEQCRTLVPQAQADAVMAVVQGEIERVRLRALHYTSHGFCRACGGADPDAVEPQRYRRPHRMHCRLYVGPLEHRRDRTDDGLFRHMDQCTCGRAYNADAGPCPDAGIDWRGPRPETTPTDSRRSE